MTENEIIEKIIELSKSSMGFALVLWGAYLIKTYVISGNVKHYFTTLRREIRAIKGIGAKLDTLIALIVTEKKEGGAERE